MDNQSIMIKNWIKLSIISGLISSVLYPTLIFFPLPELVQVVFIMAWGPLLGISAVGGYYFFKLHRETVSLRIATVSQIIAGVLVTTMLLVQYALFSAKPRNIPESGQWIWNCINQIQLGLDVAWDLFLFLAIFLFALNMYKHPKFGRIFSIVGILISVPFIALNIASFPTPPAEAGSIDLGPLAGLFGLAITINIWIRYPWLKEQLKD